MDTLTGGSIGVVEFSDEELEVADALGSTIAWRTTPRDVTENLSQSSVETVVFHLNFYEPKGLVHAIRRVRQLRPDITLLIAASSTRSLLIAEITSLVSTIGRQRDLLSDREREVLNSIKVGLTNREIAGALGISLSTVNRHVEHILRKKAARNRAQAAVE